MECIIREKSPKDIAHSDIGPIENSTEKLINENEYNIQGDEISISRFSSLSIVEPKDPLYISTINNNIYQEKGKFENSTSTVTNETMTKATKPIVFCPKIKRTTPEIENLRDITQKETASDGSEHSLNIMNNFKYENFNSPNKLRNYRKTKNDQIEKAFENTKVIITNHSTINIKNSIDNSQTSNLNLKYVDDNSQLSPNLLSNFEYENFIPLNINPKNVTFVPNNVKDTRNNEVEITSSNEVSNVNTTKLKDLDISLDKHVPYNFENRNTNAGCLFQNNTIFNNIQQSQIINEKNIIAVTTKNATSYNKMNRGFPYEKIDIRSRNNRNGLGKECETNHLPSTFEQINYNPSQINLKNSQTFNTPTFALQNHSQRQGNETGNVKKRRKYARKDKVGDTSNAVNVAKTNSQNKPNRIENVKKRKTQQMRQNKQNLVNVSTSQCISKEEIVNPDRNVTHVNSDTNKGQKKQRKLLTNKRAALDLSWVDNMKFLRVIDKEEFTRVDNLDESFWSDASLPPNIINLNDFECDDNINIWK